MGLPNINISFAQAAASAAAGLGRGIVGVMVEDTVSGGGHVLTLASQIPSGLGDANKAYVKRAFTGNDNTPKKVLLYVIDTDNDKTVSDALTWFASQPKVDWIVGHPDLDATEAGTIDTWVDTQRSSYNRNVKAVLPDYVANNKAVVNFTGSGLTDGTGTFTAAQFCSRVAGYIAGTLRTRSITYGELPELSSCTDISKADADTAIGAGKLITLYDGEKVKFGRGVNSLTTITGLSADWQKIKYVEMVDYISSSLRQTIEDDYIGKYVNNYDNQSVLMTAVSSFFEELARAGLIAKDYSVEYNVAAKRTWLTSQSVDVSEMTDDAVKRYASGTNVWITINCRIYDAIEDVTIAVNV